MGMILLYGGMIWKLQRNIMSNAVLFKELKWINCNKI